MKQTKLKFHSVIELWAFKMLFDIAEVEVNVADCTLVCTCSEEQVQKAINSFRAEIVQETSCMQ